MLIETYQKLQDANDSIKSICDKRKQALINLLYCLDHYAQGSLSPSEFDDYEKTKNILLERHSQHETL